MNLHSEAAAIRPLALILNICMCDGGCVCVCVMSLCLYLLRTIDTHFFNNNKKNQSRNDLYKVAATTIFLSTLYTWFDNFPIISYFKSLFLHASFPFSSGMMLITCGWKNDCRLCTLDRQINGAVLINWYIVAMVWLQKAKIYKNQLLINKS